MPTEAQTMQIVGVCSEISEKNGWVTFAVMAPGKQYPVKMSTKKEELIAQGREVGDAVATWTYNERESERINPNNNKPYTDRWFEGVELGATAQPSAPPASGSAPAQSGHYEPLAGGDRERSIVRQTSIKAAAELYSGRSTVGGMNPDDPDWALAVIQAAARFETWILRDLIDDIPF